MSALDPELAALIERGHCDPATVAAWAESKRIAAERASRNPPSNVDRTAAELVALRAEVNAIRTFIDEDLAEAVGAGISQAMPALVARHTGDLVAKINALEGQVREIETQRTRFRGVHEQGASYAPGDLTVRQGALWYCRRATTALPGHAPDDWVLGCKAGAVGVKRPEPARG
jgi:hypothetical protein